MTKITFNQYVVGYRKITIEIPDMDSFKKKACEHIQEEGSLNHWDLEDTFQDYCNIKVDDVDVTEEDNQEFYDKFLEFGIPTTEEEVEEYLSESES